MTIRMESVSYIYIYIHTYIYMYIYIYTHIHIHIHVHVHTHIGLIIRNYALVYTDPCTPTRMYIDAWCMHTCIDINMYIHIFMHKYVLRNYEQSVYTASRRMYIDAWCMHTYIICAHIFDSHECVKRPEGTYIQYMYMYIYICIYIYSVHEDTHKV